MMVSTPAPDAAVDFTFRLPIFSPGHERRSAASASHLSLCHASIVSEPVEQPSLQRSAMRRRDAGRLLRIAFLQVLRLALAGLCGVVRLATVFVVHGGW